MRLRITETGAGSAKVIRIEGELLAEGVSELERVCQEAAAPLRLDVTELRSQQNLAVLGEALTEGLCLVSSTVPGPGFG